MNVLFVMNPFWKKRLSDQEYLPVVLYNARRSAPSGKDTRIHGIDVRMDLRGLAVLHKLHCGPTVKSGQGFGPVPGIGHELRAKARLDLVEHFDKFPEAALCLVRMDPGASLHSVLAKAHSHRDLRGGRAQERGNCAGFKVSTVGKARDGHDDSPSVIVPFINPQFTHVDC